MEVKESKAQVFHVFSTLVSEEPAKDRFRAKDTLTSSVLLGVTEVSHIERPESLQRTTLRNASTCSTHRACPTARLLSPRNGALGSGVKAAVLKAQLEQCVTAQLTQVLRLT